MKAADNKYLLINPGVVLTPIVEPVIVALDQLFQAAGRSAYVTRALDDASGQLRTVKKYLVRMALDKKYPEAMMCENPTDKIGDYYVWQLAWSNLLKLGVIINPPLKAVCLMDYFGPQGTGSNRKGKEMPQTKHALPASTGVGCFDMGGSSGEDKTIADELVIVQKAFKKGIAGMVGIVPEHKNNCIHIDCKKV